MMVLTDKKTEKEVLLAAYDKGLFDLDEDIEYANACEPLKYEIDHF
jgi:hypothetical protein